MAAWSLLGMCSLRWHYQLHHSINAAQNWRATTMHRVTNAPARACFKTCVRPVAIIAWCWMKLTTQQIDEARGTVWPGSLLSYPVMLWNDSFAGRGRGVHHVAWLLPLNWRRQSLSALINLCCSRVYLVWPRGERICRWFAGSAVWREWLNMWVW